MLANGASREVGRCQVAARLSRLVRVIYRRTKCDLAVNRAAVTLGRRRFRETADRNVTRSARFGVRPDIGSTFAHIGKGRAAARIVPGTSTLVHFGAISAPTVLFGSSALQFAQACQGPVVKMNRRKSST